MNEHPLLAVTMGDPAGVGPEVLAKALRRPEIYERARPFVVGLPAVMQRAAGIVRSPATVRTIDSPGKTAPGPDTIDVLRLQDIEDADFPIGRLSVASARAAYASVLEAARLALEGAVDAMVTSPVNKAGFEQASIHEIGHTEILKRVSGAGHVATMLVSGNLRCMHLSTHKSLPEACEFVTKENVLAAVRLTDEHFKMWGFTKPRIAVAALNPHGGDNGLIGRHEIEEIQPAVEAAQAEGIDASGPIPADSVFNQAIAGRYDVVMVLYHDQGHIPIKVHGFEQSVSVNLGLPFIRTSVDHGTAFDIAGTGKADETSMVEAIRLAVALATSSALA